MKVERTGELLLMGMDFFFQGVEKVMMVMTPQPSKTLKKQKNAAL